MPAQIASRDDMTLAQKQRLAVLAKMGVGPVASPGERSARPLNQTVDRIEGPPPVDRRAVLLERERRMREQEEKQREEEERIEAEKAKKKEKRKNTSGLARLGPVMPREEDIPQFLPAPAKEPSLPPRRYQEGSERRAEDDGDDEEDEAPEHPSSASGAGARTIRIVQSEELRQRLGAGTKKKKRKRVREDGAGEELQGDDDYEDDEEPMPEVVPPRKPREGGISKQSMVVESVKGKVSHANKNLTDADLERRFQLHDNQRDTGSLMTEEEVLRLIRKERKEKQPNFGSAARRVQRELAEWETAKEVQRARVKSPHRFERMVVARK